MKKQDVQVFGLNIEDQLFQLHEDLKCGAYRHGPYERFFVHDPKRRLINKATVRDRVLHHAVFRILEPLFDRTFIFDSWSCRTRKGHHHAVERFHEMAWGLSRNNKRTVWVLKLDIKNYFASVRHDFLVRLLKRRISDDATMHLLENIIGSYDPGLPLGNVTSQLFANIYLNELDQFVKHVLIQRIYLRYCDDMILVGINRTMLVKFVARLSEFVSFSLAVSFHPKKILLQSWHGGVDVLGYISFPYYRLLRTTTKQRLLKRITERNAASYRGLLHGVRARRLREMLRERYDDCV